MQAKKSTKYKTDARKEGGKEPNLDFGQSLPREGSNHTTAPLFGFTLSPSSTTNRIGSHPFDQLFQRSRPSQRETTSALIAFNDSQSQEIRPKVFDMNAYDSAKVNIRRPPKGIQNWFDGFDISSDEEEQEQDISGLPVSESNPSPSGLRPYCRTPSQEGSQKLPVVDSLEESSARTPRGFLEPSVRAPFSRRNPIEEMIDKNILMIENARQKMQARQVIRSTPIACRSNNVLATPGGNLNMDRSAGGGSRLAMSHLADESVLALSDSSEDE